MFTTLGLFTGVACPQGEHCALLTCMFSHARYCTGLTKPSSGTTTSSDTIDTHTPKKLKTQESISSTEPLTLSHKVSNLEDVVNGSRSTSKPSQQLPRRTSDRRSSETPVTRPGASTSPSCPSSNLETDEPSSSPITRQPTSSELPPRKVRKESLNPRMLTKAPAPHATRSAILTKLHAVMVSNNEKLAKSKDSSKKSFVLTADELVTMALDEEEDVAKGNPGVYSNVIKLRIVKLTKMSSEDWAKEVMKHLNTRYYKIPVAPTPDATKPIETGLTTRQEITFVPRLITPLNGLEEFGYVTKPPTAAEIETSKQGVTDSKGWEKCERCASRFQVFPGRREDGALTTGGPCTYHPNRPVIPPRKKTDSYTGSGESYFPCCGESVGTSIGCTKGAQHVFKISESKRLASILQFETTPRQLDKGALDPVCFDCEMGYTTQGLELIRLTAVSWPEGRELLDVLVKPIGEVLDLNSRFSGVYPEHFAKAIPYGTSDIIPNSPSQSGQGNQQKPMQVVESPAAARELLFQFLQPETPLIGHAIDNDLNVCRIIHPTIIDTVILYPASRGGLPNRMSLKTLARKFLSREVQTGGAKGHDSKEDAITTGDLVRAMVRDCWKKYKHHGWRFEGDHMVSPPNQETYYVNRQGLYVPSERPHDNDNPVEHRIESGGAGQKRKQPSPDDSTA